MSGTRRMKIGVIGRVADGVDLFDGQTVTTRLFRDAFEKAQPNSQVYCVDTYRYKQRAAIVLLRSFICLMRCDHILILLSANGLRFYLPFLYYTNKLFQRRLYHRVIGGSFHQFLQKNKAYIRYANAFEVTWVETNTLKEALTSLGVMNAEISPTFRYGGIVCEADLPADSHPPFRFCTFCRVTKPKGVGTAIRAIQRVNQRAGRVVAVLDVYGPMDQAYRAEFEAALADDPAVQYRGCVRPEESVDTLKAYYMLLFPTVWEGEGFPGTLIDAFAAGLPTIATDWNYNAEILTEGETGFCYDPREDERLVERIEYAVNDPNAINGMRRHCLQEAEKYRPEFIMAQIMDRMREAALS